MSLLHKLLRYVDPIKGALSKKQLPITVQRTQTSIKYSVQLTTLFVVGLNGTLDSLYVWFTGDKSEILGGFACAI